MQLCYCALDQDGKFEFFKKAILSLYSLNKLNITIDGCVIAVYQSTLDRYKKNLNLRRLVESLSFEVQFQCIDANKLVPKLQKIELIHHCLKNYDEFYYIDVDTIFVRNPFEYLETLFIKKGYHIIAAPELNTCLDAYHENINSGFLRLKSSEESLKVVRLWRDTFIQRIENSDQPLKVADQPCLRMALEKIDISVGYMPREFNFRGHEAQYFLEWAWIPIHVVHNHLIFESSYLKPFITSFDFYDTSGINKLLIFLKEKYSMRYQAHKPKLINFWKVLTVTDLLKYAKKKLF